MSPLPLTENTGTPPRSASMSWQPSDEPNGVLIWRISLPATARVVRSILLVRDGEPLCLTRRASPPLLAETSSFAAGAATPMPTFPVGVEYMFEPATVQSPSEPADADCHVPTPTPSDVRTYPVAAPGCILNVFVSSWSST